MPQWFSIRRKALGADGFAYYPKGMICKNKIPGSGVLLGNTHTFLVSDHHSIHFRYGTVTQSYYYFFAFIQCHAFLMPATILFQGGDFSQPL